MVLGITFFLIFILLQTLSTVVGDSTATTNYLVWSENASRFNTGSGFSGPTQCTKNSDESYAVCASLSNTAIKFNLQPFAFAAKGPNQGDRMISCDLYETASQSTSRAVCVKGGYRKYATVYFHRVFDMVNVSKVTIGVTEFYPYATVDTPNEIAYISNYLPSPAIFKMQNISGATPFVAATLASFGFGDENPASMLIIGGFLYVHLAMFSARLARINISTFTWNQTITFAFGEYYGHNDNLVNDDNYIYDLTQNGILVRCTYKNNNFSRFDSLITGYEDAMALSISPDQRIMFLVCKRYDVLRMIQVSSFSLSGDKTEIRGPLGRPIVTSSQHVYVFTESSDDVFAFVLTNSTEAPPSFGFPGDDEIESHHSVSLSGLSFLLAFVGLGFVCLIISRASAERTSDREASSVPTEMTTAAATPPPPSALPLDSVHFAGDAFTQDQLAAIVENVELVGNEDDQIYHMTAGVAFGGELVIVDGEQNVKLNETEGDESFNDEGEEEKLIGTEKE